MKKIIYIVCLLIGLIIIAGLFFYKTAKSVDFGGAASAPQEINHKQSAYFKTPDFFNLISDKNLTILSNYPTYQQTTEYSCGPAAALTVLKYYNHKNSTEKYLIKEMGTSSQIGTNVKGIAGYFRTIGWNVKQNQGDKNTFNTYEQFADFIIQQLNQGHPILVENAVWGGHWRVIIGYDTIGTNSTLDDVLIFADPYDTADHNQDGYTIGNGQEFFWAWFEHKFPENERHQPFVVAYP